MNPYTKQDKFSKFQIDKLVHTIRFKSGENITLNYAWAIKGVSKFIRLYVRTENINNFTKRILKIFITNFIFHIFLNFKKNKLNLKTRI